MEPLRFLPCRVSSLLATTVAAAIAVSQYKAANALTAQEIAPLTISTTVFFDSSLGLNSKEGVTISHLDILYSFRGRNVLVKAQEDPPPSEPSKPGGSR